MQLLLALVLMLIGAILLLYGADWFLDGVRDLSLALGISSLALGVLLVGLEPEEMLTAAIASGQDAPALAVGNVVGTNVTIIIGALGLSALLRPIALAQSVRRQALIASAVSLLPIVLLFFGNIPRLIGILLLIIFGSYTLLLLRIDRAAIARMAAAESDEDNNDDDEAGDPATKQRRAVRRRDVARTIGGALAMTLGGFVLVQGAKGLANSSGLGEGSIGATLVSLATGAEMIALGVTAARKGQSEVLVGGILGSFAYNLLVTLGLAAVVRPIAIDPLPFLPALLTMVVAHLALLLLILRGRIGRGVGALFVIGYVVYLLVVTLAH